MPALQVENARVQCKDGANTHTLLFVPTLHVAQGELIGIKGASGSGKTTLLRLFSGLITPSAGSLYWGTTCFSSLKSAKKAAWRREHAGIIFQDFQLLHSLSVLENVLMPLTFSHAHIPAIMREKARDLLNTVGITQYAQKAGRLSRGEMQRVAYCRAILQEPDILFADEPTASLDAPNAALIHELLLAYHATHACSMFIVSHDVAFCAQLPRCLTLEKGNIVENAHV